MGAEMRLHQPLNHVQKRAALVSEVSCFHQWNQPPCTEEGMQTSLQRRLKQKIREHTVHEMDDGKTPLPDVSWHLGENEVSDAMESCVMPSPSVPLQAALGV